MAKAWQLKKLSTNEVLRTEKVLPHNFGPLFGLDQTNRDITDLSWAGIQDRGWFEVDVEEATSSLKTKKELIEDKINFYLKDTVEYVAADNTSITKEQRALWIEYRIKLRDLLTLGFDPDNVSWPTRPE